MTTSYQIGGTVSGLAGGGLVLRNNGTDSLTITASGSFTFPVAVASGSAFAVTVGTQPSGPTQECSVSGGSGTVASASVTTIAITCATSSFTVGGTVSGLAGSGLALLNGDEKLAIDGNGAFTFHSPVASGAVFSVNVFNQPTGPAQVCSVRGGSGTIGSRGVDSIAITCATSAFTVGGTVVGLNGSGLVLQLNGGGDLTVDAAGTFAFPAPVADQSSYEVTVKQHASSPTQYCGVKDGSGTMAGANVTGVRVNCPVSVAARATALGQNRVDVSWNAIGLVPVRSALHRSPTAGSPGEIVGEDQGSYRDSGLTPNTTYYYTVRAYTSAGTSVWSAQVSATTAATPSFSDPVRPPRPVTGLTATRVGNTVTLSWDAYDGATVAYISRTVDHQLPLGGPYTQTDVGSGRAYVTTVTDIIAGNGLYSYLVELHEATRTLIASAEVEIDVPAGTLPGIEQPIFDIHSCARDSSGWHIYWYAAPGAEAYHVYAAPFVGLSAPAVITPSQGGTTAALDSLTSNRIHEVRPGYYGFLVPYALLSDGRNAIAVEAVRGTYRSVGGGQHNFGKLAPAPVGVTGVTTSARNPTTVRITWDASTGAGRYQVYGLASSTDVISPAKLLGTTTGTSYDSTGLMPGSTYYYRVTAIAGGAGGGAESAASDYALATTFTALLPLPLLPVPLGLGQAWLGWIGGNTHGTTYRIYGGGALDPLAIDSSNLVTQTTVESSTGRSTWNTYVSAPAAAYAVFALSGGLVPVYGLYWIEEVYPDGTFSGRNPFLMFAFL